MDDIPGSRAVSGALTLELVAARPPLPAGVTFRDDAIGGGNQRVAVRVYYPGQETGRTGALLFIHGGAFVFGNLELEHERCLYYAAVAGCVVVAVDYRLAPEHPYPAALDDCTVALEWLAARSEELGVDPKRICVGGASAGGALAAGVVLRARDEGSVAVAAQLLMYPVLDDRGDYASMTRFDVYDPWDGQRSRKMWPAYLGREGDAPIYAAPARAPDLRGLPATFMMCCEEDPLRDEDLAFAQRLLSADVSVELHHYCNTYHAFDVIATPSAIAQRALGEQAQFLRNTIG